MTDSLRIAPIEGFAVSNAGNMASSSGSDYSSTGINFYSTTPPANNDLEMTYDSTSTNPEKIAFVEKLIRTRKITLTEGLLLLQEKVTIKTQVIQLTAPVSTNPIPLWSPNPYSPTQPFGPSNPVFTSGTGLAHSGASSQRLGVADNLNPRISEMSERQEPVSFNGYAVDPDPRHSYMNELVSQ